MWTSGLTSAELGLLVEAGNQLGQNLTPLLIAARDQASMKGQTLQEVLLELITHLRQNQPMPEWLNKEQIPHAPRA